MSVISLLRSRTAAAHEAVDAAFGAFDLRKGADYRLFLCAHAQALPDAEAAAAAVWPALRRRTPALMADLAALGAPATLPVTTNGLTGAAQWGALYVVEGSRLGGGILARSVGAGLPHAYLSAVHEPGEWRTIRLAIDAAGTGQGTEWHEEAVNGALTVFRDYEAAAAIVPAAP